MGGGSILVYTTLQALYFCKLKLKAFLPFDLHQESSLRMEKSQNHVSLSWRWSTKQRGLGKCVGSKSPPILCLNWLWFESISCTESSLSCYSVTKAYTASNRPIPLTVSSCWWKLGGMLDSPCLIIFHALVGFVLLWSLNKWFSCRDHCSHNYHYLNEQTCVKVTK